MARPVVVAAADALLHLALHLWPDYCAERAIACAAPHLPTAAHGIAAPWHCARGRCRLAGARARGGVLAGSQNQMHA